MKKDTKNTEDKNLPSNHELNIDASNYNIKEKTNNIKQSKPIFKYINFNSGELKSSLMEEPEFDIERIGENEEIHAGHKSRLRNKALAHLELLSEHEVLEVLLNFGVVRKNTNPLAHSLINKYGSLVNVMDADYYDLLKQPGVGEISASLITLIPKMIRFYTSRKVELFKTIESLGEAITIFKALFSTFDHEVLIVACIAEDNRLLGIEKVAEGTMKHIHVDLAQVLKFVLKHNPQKVLVAHNHLSYNAMPSHADVVFTQDLNNVLKKLDIELTEHFVTCLTDEYSCIVAKTLRKASGETLPIPDELP